MDDHTLQLHWTADVSPSVALNILSTPIASIVDEKQVAANVKDNDFGNAWLKMHSAGSGAFKMRVYQPHQAIVLEANDAAPGGAPKLKSIIIKNVPDPASRRLLIQQGMRTWRAIWVQTRLAPGRQAGREGAEHSVRRAELRCLTPATAPIRC